MRAEIEIECQKPQIVVKALRPEIDMTKKFTVKLLADKTKVRLLVEASDTSGLLAGINSYVTLIKTSINAMEE